MTQLNKSAIIELLKQNDKAVARALVVLKDRQTSSEQTAKSTFVDNGEGFRPCHARIGTAMAQFYEKHGYLTERQVAYWRKEGKQGMRIAIYWKQLIQAAMEKAAKAA